jgi:hypothetical protein
MVFGHVGSNPNCCHHEDNAEVHPVPTVVVNVNPLPSAVSERVASPQKSVHQGSTMPVTAPARPSWGLLGAFSGVLSPQRLPPDKRQVSREGSSRTTGPNDSVPSSTRGGPMFPPTNAPNCCNPAPNNRFLLPVVNQGSHRSPEQSIRPSQTTTTTNMAIQQAIVIASIQDRHSAKLDAKFDKLTNAEDFEWWLSQVKGRLQHDAWRNDVLDDGKPCVATSHVQQSDLEQTPQTSSPVHAEKKS